MESTVATSLYAELSLDLDALLAPLPEGDGGGVDVRYTPEFEALSDARREEDDTDQGIWQTDAKKADWHEVVRMACAILETQSKDLQSAVWLVQGLVRLHGFKGLIAGLDLLARLTMASWPVLWPRIDEDGDMDSRMAPFFWLDTHLPKDLLLLEITAGADGERRGLTYQVIVNARKLQQLATSNPKAYQQAVADGDVTMEVVGRHIDATATELVAEMRRNTVGSLSALASLSQALDDAAGREAPSFAKLRKVLRDIDTLFANILDARGHSPRSGRGDKADKDGARGDRPRAATSALPAAVSQSTDQTPASSRRGEGLTMTGNMPVIHSRRGAYELLDHAAEWLLYHEPHSPAPYLVKRAVAWEHMSLRDVLSELMERGADAETIFKVLGIGEDGRPAQSAGKRVESMFDD